MCGRIRCLNDTPLSKPERVEAVGKCWTAFMNVEGRRESISPGMLWGLAVVERRRKFGFKSMIACIESLSTRPTRAFVVSEE